MLLLPDLLDEEALVPVLLAIDGSAEKPVRFRQDLGQDLVHMLAPEPAVEVDRIVNSSGAGKSTFMKLIMREEKANTGKIFVI